MNKILTCTDGSRYAASVYELTAWAAVRSSATVHLLHVIDAHREKAEIVDLSGNFGFDLGEKFLGELVSLEESKARLARERGAALLEAAKRQLASLGISDVVGEQQHGELVESVVRMEAEACLVVLGRRGESAGQAKNHLGTNLERVVRESIRPVLVADQEFRPIQRFVLACDGGPSSERAVDFAIAHPLLQGLECHLVHAGGEEKGKAILELAAARFRGAGYVVTSEVAQGHAEKVITDAVDRVNAHLLVMGAYGHSRIRELLVGSTTTAMLRASRVPVLMFR